MIKKATAIIFLFYANLAAATVCDSDQQEIFYCTAKEKIVSLCMLRTDESSRGAVIYKFGTAEKIELEISSVDRQNDDIFFISSHPIPNGAENRVRFSNFGYEYIIYDVQATYGYSGVVVRKDGKNIKQIRCDNDATLKAPAYELLQEEKFNENVIISE